jgi:catechol 2,3-dioxygenase-like lactoylglutathione lyase family enzyme
VTYFHVGYIVPDLEAGMDELTRVLGVTWREPIDRSSPYNDMRWRLVYSSGPQPWIELVEGRPGTPWHCTDGPLLHHIGAFTYDLDADVARFEAAGGRIEVDGREISGRWIYFRVPQTGALIELIEADDERRARYMTG